MLEGLLSALPDPAAATAALDSSECSYYSCDHSSDYITTGSDGASNLTGDGTIYPAYTPFSGAEASGSTTQLWGLEQDHTGDYISTQPNPNPLTGDGVIYPAYDPSYAADPNSTTQLWGLDQDHTGDYIGTSPEPLTGDGVIYPAYDPSYAADPNSTTQLWGLDQDHTGDYIGTSPEPLTGDGVIYPAYDPSYAADPNSTTQLWGLEQDHTGDYIGSDGSLLGDGVIYPAQEGAAPGTTMSLMEGADHSGAYYCTESEADCSTEIVDPVLKPIEYPMGVTMALAAPIAAAPVPKKGDKEAPAKPGPGHLMLMGTSCLFGAAEATVKMFSGDKSGSWIADFQAESCKAADAVTPVGGFLLKKGMAQEA